jgi:hypothetical protein
VYGGSVKIIAINGTYKVSDSVYFVSEDQITHLLTVVVGQVVNERTISLLFCGELDSDHYDALLLIEVKVRFVFINILC